MVEVSITTRKLVETVQTTQTTAVSQASTELRAELITRRETATVRPVSNTVVVRG